jgi:asparagine synthetase B (glutamine-hydrolysing)
MKSLLATAEQKSPVAELEEAIKKECKKYEGTPVAISGGIDSGVLASFIKPELLVTVELPCGDKYNEVEYSKVVARHLKKDLTIIQTEQIHFESGMKEAVKAIGRPIPHFNIFALYTMYKRLNEMGIKQLVVGDGPDESMSGYTRNMIMNYIYTVYGFEGFRNYHPTIDKILSHPIFIYANLVGKSLEEVSPLMDGLTLIKGMNKVDMILMRKDMDAMGDGLAKYFGIKLIRPYQDNKELDQLMFNMPDDLKIYDDIGKVGLRMIAEKYLPVEIAWRIDKVGGPVYPVNLMQGWTDKGEFDKTEYLAYQQKILDR